MRIVLDTNCFLAIVPKRSPYRPVFDAFRSGQFELAIGTAILHEYEELFAQRMTPTIAQNLLSLLERQPNTYRTEIFYYWQLIERDPSDNKFVDTAIASNADFLVTNDGHFHVLSTIDFPRVTCLTLKQFMDRLEVKN